MQIAEQRHAAEDIVGNCFAVVVSEDMHSRHAEEIVLLKLLKLVGAEVVEICWSCRHAVVENCWR